MFARRMGYVDGSHFLHASHWLSQGRLGQRQLLLQKQPTDGNAHVSMTVFSNSWR
jgi:hypothetical protein